MCGIVGIWDFKNRVDRSILKKMRDVMEHRGPDDKGSYVDNQIGLAQRRLSIIDLSKKGRQPMSNEDGSLWITYNGEIYNFKDIKIKLEQRGHKFKSDTDTEVIIHAYEEYGERCLSMFNGMFAFCIWDSNKKQFFLARDRLGQKPLVYYQDKDKFIFASELKAILEYPYVNKDISDEAVSHYLSFGYVPTPLCIFENMKKLPPGHYAVLDRNNNIFVKEYWNLNLGNTIKKTEKEYCEDILMHLKDATEKRMISDVPLGAFLSGGIDSSAVVAMMSKITDNVKTFSIGFEEQDFDETKYARKIAEMFNTDHKEKIVRMDAAKLLDKLVWHYNEPYADSSAIPTYYLCEMTRKDVTVALSGDAGDESFLGYTRYVPDKYEKISKTIPNMLKPAMSGAGKIFFPETSSRAIFQKIGRRMELLSMKEEEQYLEWLSNFDSYHKEKIIQERLKNYNSKNVLLEQTKNYSDTILKKQYFDFKHYLSDDILVKVDIASMAHSLEVRSPFLDHNLVEYASKIPWNVKMKGNITKYILKKSLEPVLPKDILYRKKTGFAVPLVHWFRKDLRSMGYDVLLNKETINRGYFDRYAVRKLLNRHNNGENHAYRIWNLLFLEKWFRRFAD
ncbi:asparagine synthase (glutamine-hydrolyzing) [Candidatus Woesearchaeota archaeon]|nr:asparagine synthase (glutamine-hydrolyzing) [Candidatus Woesearchaeota archaeon]